MWLTKKHPIRARTPGLVSAWCKVPAVNGSHNVKKQKWKFLLKILILSCNDNDLPHTQSNLDHHIYYTYWQTNTKWAELRLVLGNRLASFSFINVARPLPQGQYFWNALTIYSLSFIGIGHCCNAKHCPIKQISKISGFWFRGLLIPQSHCNDGTTGTTPS